MNNSASNLEQDSTLNAFESYVLSEGNLEESLRHLVKGSEDYNSLYFLDLLKKKGANLSSSEESEFKDYLECSKSNWSAKLSIWYDFLRYSPEKSNDEKSKILEEINEKYTKIRFDNIESHYVNAESQNVKEGKDINQVTVIDWEKEINLITTKISSLDELSLEGLRMVKIDSIYKMDDLLMYFKKLKKEIVTVPQKPLFDKIKVMLEQREYYSKHDQYIFENILESFFEHFSIEQLDTLHSISPMLLKEVKYFKSYLMKKYHKVLKRIELGNSIQERKEAAIELYNYSQTMTHLYPELKSYILNLILYLDNDMGEHSETTLKEYLKAPYATYSYLKNKQLTDKLSLDFVKIDDENFEALMLNYFIDFIKKGLLKKDFIGYFQPDWLDQTWGKALAFSGGTLNPNDLSDSVLKTINKESKLIISKKNKESFTIEEVPNIVLTIKNISTLFVKVFEINIEEYYKFYGKSFPIDINMDGPAPTFEKTLEFKESPCLIHETKIEFPELKKKLGVFLIDFHGDDKKSRAVIRIGSLTLEIGRAHV